MRRITAAAAIVLLTTLGACGGSDDTAPSSSDGASSSETSDETAGQEEDAGPAFDPCTGITPAEVEQVLGYAVIKEEVPGGGCSWGNEEDPRLASFSVTAGTDADLGGGIESAKAGTQAVLFGDAQDLPGLGDAAFLVVGKGKAFAKDSFQAQGVIESGGLVYTVGITQLGGATEAEVQTQASSGMELVASKL